MPSRHLVIILLTLLGAFASATEVSRIDTSGPRPLFIVDGKPFFYHGVQISPHRLESDFGWTWAQFAPLFAQAAADGFTVMPVPITWNAHEGARNSWDWSRLETAIDHAAHYGIPIEVLWFGASVSATWNCVPSYGSSHQLLVNSSGHAVTDAAGHTKYDLSDPSLLADEKAALITVMAHVATYLAAKGYPGHTVVGVQVMNEPTVTVFEDGSAPTDRSYSASANAKWSSGGWSNATRFNADVLHHYLLTLAKVVKDSSQQVWTRVNLCDAWEPEVHFQLVTNNEALRNGQGGTPLDFIGVDPYSSSTNQIYDVCTNTAQYRQGKNLMLVMENSGLYANTDKLMFNALAGNANYCIWELNQSIPNWDCGLYSTDYTARTISPRSHTQSVRDFNTMIAKDRRDLATLVAGGSNLSFYNRGFSASSNSSAAVGGRSISYSTSSAGGGIALARSDGSLVFLSTAAGTFTVPLAEGLARLELGFFAADDSWVPQSQQVWANSSGNVTFTLPAHACARGLPAGLIKGSGWSGSYFASSDFSGTPTARTDTAIDFDWGTGSPMASLPADNFTVRWSGTIMPAFTETYTFTSTSDDGIRVWVGGTLVIDRWVDQAPTAVGGQKSLTANTPVQVVVEYYERGGGAVARLEWQSASQARQMVPASTPATGNQLPAGWTAADISTPGATGSTTVSNGTWTVVGSGADIWGTADEFQFVSMPVTGDVRITAKVVSETNTHAWAKAGVMLRESTTTGSRHAFTCVTATQGTAFQRRMTENGSSAHTSGVNKAAPYWVRLERVGTTCIGSVSPDGVTWTEIRRETIAIPSQARVGLAVTSHVHGTSCTAVFSNVEVISAAAAAN